MRNGLRMSTRIVGFSAILVGSGTIGLVPASAHTLTASNTTGSSQSITTIAGNGDAGSTGDGGPAVKAELNTPEGVAEDLSGTLYIADTYNNEIRKVVNPTTINADTISKVAGTGTGGFSGDGGAAVAADLSKPAGIAVDSQGNLFIADTGNNRVREVNTAGVISTIAGDGACVRDTLGNGGPALSASLCGPTGIAIDSTGVYVADTGHNEVRRISNGTITDVAGNNTQGYSGDGGPATKAALSSPTGVVLDTLHDLFVSDTGNYIVREVSAGGTITTFAGIPGHSGYSGNGGPATKAKLGAPTGLGLDPSGNLYVSDTANHVLRKVDTTGTITTFAGTGSQGFSGDGGPATRAKLSFPTGAVAVDGTAVYFSDTGNQRVRGVFNGPPPVLPESSFPVLLPIGGGVIVLGGAAALFIRRRRLAVAI